MNKTSSLFAIALAASAGAAAQDFPSRPLRIVVPNPAGGTVEIVARAIAQPMSAALGQPVVVELKPGGENVIGSDAVAKSPADGYTLLLAGTHLTINPLVRKLPYDGLNAFAPVARLAQTPVLFAVHPSVAVKSVQELIATARSKPDAFNYASSTAGSSIHLAGEMFKSRAGIDMNYIPYQGGVQATLAVLGGHAQVLVAPVSDAAPYLASGRLRPIAVTSLARFDLIPEVPTVAESGFPGFQVLQWFGAVVPAGTPKPFVARLGGEMLKSLESQALRGAFGKLGILPAPLDAEAFEAFLRKETSDYQAIIRQARIKAQG